MEYFPKGKNIGDYSSKDVKNVVNKINRRARKCLNWKKTL